MGSGVSYFDDDVNTYPPSQQDGKQDPYADRRRTPANCQRSRPLSAHRTDGNHRSPSKGSGDAGCGAPHHSPQSSPPRKYGPLKTGPRKLSPLRHSNSPCRAEGTFRPQKLQCTPQRPPCTPQRPQCTPQRPGPRSPGSVHASPARDPHSCACTPPQVRPQPYGYPSPPRSAPQTPAPPPRPVPALHAVATSDNKAQMLMPPPSTAASSFPRGGRNYAAPPPVRYTSNAVTVSAPSKVTLPAIRGAGACGGRATGPRPIRAG